MHPYRGWPFLSAPHHPGLSAAWAVFAHGFLSLIVVLPIVMRSNRRARFATLAFVGGVALDLDHAVAAGNLSPRAMEHLGHRPDTHSLLLAALLALVALALTRRKLVAWSAFAIFVAHLLFDAAGAGVYWLYPLREPDSIPWLACPVGIAVLVGVSAVFARRMNQTGAPPSRSSCFPTVRPGARRQSVGDAMSASQRRALARRCRLPALGSLMGCLALVLPLSTHGAERRVEIKARRSSAALHLIWSENFDGRAGARPNARRWSYDVGGGGWGNEELEYYTSRQANARLDGRGHLVIAARAERYTGTDGVTRSYTSARLQTLHKFQFQYGLVQARIKVPAGRGLRPAFWMLGNDAYQPQGWPRSGEIDNMEVLGSQPDVVKGTVHGPWPSAPHGVGSRLRSSTSLASGFHVYGVAWESDRISFLLDGSVYETITPADLPVAAAWPFQHPYFLLLDVAVGGVATGTPAPAMLPAKMIVDWVRVWQRL
jgi:membrane-bound metal-dependent hydrolase YbcI (DUF457 family)